MALDTTEKIGYGLLGVAALACIAASVPSITARQQQEAVIEKELEPVKMQNLRTAAEEQIYLANADTAIERYKSGVCEPLVKATEKDVTPLKQGKESTRIAEVIRQGEPIVHGSVIKEYLAASQQNPKAPPAFFKGFYLPEGTVICDFDGKTAVTVFDKTKGHTVSGNVAITRDSATIGAFRKQYPALYKPTNAAPRNAAPTTQPPKN